MIFSKYGLASLLVWNTNEEFTWYSRSSICCWFCNSFDEFVRFDFNCKSSLPVCLSGYSEHQIHLHITQFWQILWFAPKFSTLVIETDANSQNERGKQNCSILDPEPACCWKRLSLKTQILPFANSGERFGANAAKCFGSLWEFCGSHWSESSAGDCSLIYRLLALVSYTHKWLVECNIGTSCWLKDHRLLPSTCPS